jgi:phosphoribosylglycinamide formyltransferase 2
MVTLAGTQNFNEFELHARAILGLPIPEILLMRYAASAVILAKDDNAAQPEYYGLEEAASYSNSDFKIFGKPNTRKYRRMGVALAHDVIGSDIDKLRYRAKTVAGKIKVNGL